MKRLAQLGLVEIAAHRVTFARSAEDIRLESGLEGFCAFFQALPNRRRTVPVPRRTLRALAAGFSRAVTAYMIAALIRSVFWTRAGDGGGEYRTDGRAKLSWIADTFGISRRAATDARARLIELGWLEPIEAQQWELNRWGVRDAVNVSWAPRSGEALDLEAGAAGDAVDAPADASVDNSQPAAVEEEGSRAGGSASPCLNRSSLSTRDSKTRRLRARAPGPSGDCISSSSKPGNKKRAERSASRSGKPNIRDIRPEHLQDPETLLELREQAIKLGFDFAGEGGELDFLALANRARARGHRPGAIFFDLIKNRRTAFITIVDEEAARAQLRELREGPDTDLRGGGGEWSAAPEARELTEEERIVERGGRAGGRS